MDVDTTFLTGSAAFLSAVIVFCGSVFLLLALVMGARLAYMVTASITLAFVLMMGLVWSYGDPLGPVGQLPEWHPVDIGTDASQLEFGPAADYPDGWDVPLEGDETVGELETTAGDYLATAIADGDVTEFESPTEAQVDPEATRLLDREGSLHGAVTFIGLEATPSEDAPPVIAVLEYDPGNPSGPARMITAGTFVLLAGHLFFLSRMEKRATRRKTDDDDETEG
jgi:hypothetical protein